MSEFTGSQVNQVLRLVHSLSDDGDTQLSILAVALATACRSAGLDYKDVASPIRDAFNDQRELVALFQS